MAITKLKKAKNNKQSIFNCKVVGKVTKGTKNEDLSFTISMYSGFSSITSQDLYKVLTGNNDGISIQTTPENVDNNVSFTINHIGKEDREITLGRIAFYENDLTDDSTESEQDSVIKTLIARIRKAGSKNIVKRLTNDEGAEIISGILKPTDNSTTRAA